MRKLFKKFRVPPSSRYFVEPEDIFFEGSKLKDFEEAEINAGKLEKPISGFVFFAAKVVKFSVLIFFLGYSAFLVLGKGDEYLLSSKDNSSRALPVFAERGLIYSSDGVLLAGNEVYFDIIINFAQDPESIIKEEDFLKLSRRISEALGREADYFYQKIKGFREENFSESRLIRGLTSAEIARLKDVIGDFNFIEVRESSRRRFSDNFSLSHLVGYTGEASKPDINFNNYFRGERVGKTGIELFYNDILRGRGGVLIRKIDSRGHILNSQLTREPKRGRNITLHLDSVFQKKVYEILKEHTGTLGVDSAAAVVLNPNTGAILSSVSLPSFNVNLFESGINNADFGALKNNPNKPFVNRVIEGEYPSGSTIKPIIAAAALEEKIADPDFLVYSGGAIQVPSVYNSEVLYEFKDWKAHGWTDIRKAIADSVNIYFYTIGGGYKDKEGLGIQKIGEYLRKFGWGRALGVDIPGEKSGLIPSPKWKKENKNENWYIGDTYHVSIGQGDILATPLQVAASTAVFANGGRLLTPHAVSAIGEKEIQRNVIRENFVSPQNLEVVRRGMRRAVEEGSSKFLSTLSIQAAGKTGTAQTGRAKNHAWFTGFAPYENPEIVVSVLLEEGGKSDYAVRVAKDIIGAYFDM